ncbi:hypothetical protein J6590_104224, partial [Homalodisca vitripennis]
LSWMTAGSTDVKTMERMRFFTIVNDDFCVYKDGRGLQIPEPEQTEYVVKLPREYLIGTTTQVTSLRRTKSTTEHVAPRKGED